MKKIYSFLVMAVAMLASTLSVQADVWYADGMTGATQEVQEGTKYALKFGRGDQGDRCFLNHDGTWNKSVATDNNIFYFEKAGDNWKIYFLDENNTKQYVANTSNLGASFTTTINSRIGTYIVSPAQFYSTDDMPESLEPGHTLYENVEEETEVTLLDADAYLAEEPDTAFLGAANTNNSAGRTYNRQYNVWYIMPMDVMSGRQYLDAVLEVDFADFDPENYEAGINPGQYDEQALNDVIDAFNAAMEGAADDATCKQLADNLLEKYDAFKKSFVPFGEGYYIFTSQREPSTGALFDNYGGICGVKTSGGHDISENVAWAWSGATNNLFQYNEDDDEWMSNGGAKYFVWHVYPAGENLYYVQNWGSGRYIGTAENGHGAAVKSVATEAEANRFNMAPNTTTAEAAGFWEFFSPDLPTDGWNAHVIPSPAGLHAPGDWMGLVSWDANEAPSSWKPRTVTQEMLDEIEALSETATNNMNLNTLVNQTKTAIAGAKGFIVPVEGLVTTAEQLGSNAADPEEGKDFGFLLDGDVKTMWHSNWHANGPQPEEDGAHSLDMTLSEAAQLITIQVITRDKTGGQADGRPTAVRIMASNDGELWDEIVGTHQENVGSDEEPVWEEADGWLFTYDDDISYTSANNGNAHPGYLTVDLGNEYTYVRMLVDETKSNAKSGDGVFTYFNLSEVRVVKGEASFLTEQEDMSSKYYGVSEAIRTELEGALSVAEDELADEAATKETIARLQAALDAFVAAIPDPETVKAAKDKAIAFANAAEEGEDIGYYQTGAISELQNAIANISVNNQSSVAECNEALDKINSAYAVFVGKLNKPVNGTYYLIQSGAAEQEANEEAEDPDAEATRIVTQYPHNDYIGIRNADPSHIAWGGESHEDQIDEYKGYVWKAETNEDGTFSLLNVMTGRYMQAPEKVQSGKAVELKPEKASFTYQSAKVPGLINIVYADGVYANCEPASNKLVTWGSAQGEDNSAFRFLEAEAPKAGDEWSFEITNSDLRVMTLPVSVSNLYDQAYTVLGSSEKDGKVYIELKKMAEDETIAAGTPFVFDPSEYKEITFGIKALDCVFEGKHIDGLKGVLDDTILPTDNGAVFKKGQIVFAVKGESVAAGHGFFTNGLASVAYGAGDMQILSVDGQPTAIQNVVVVNSKNAGTYDLQGRRVVNAVKGLYIINGQKVLVK